VRVGQIREPDPDQIDRSLPRQVQSEDRRRRHVLSAPPPAAPSICQRVTGFNASALSWFSAFADRPEISTVAPVWFGTSICTGLVAPSPPKFHVEFATTKKLVESGVNRPRRRHRQRRRGVRYDRALLRRPGPSRDPHHAPRKSFVSIPSVLFPIVVADWIPAATSGCNSSRQ
jgi:hypothetical protein